MSENTLLQQVNPMSPAPWVATVDARISNLDMRVTRLETAMEFVQRDIAEIRADVRSLYDLVGNLRDAVAANNARIDVLSTSDDRLASTVTTLEKSIASFQTKALWAVTLFVIAAVLKSAWPVLFPG